MFLELLENDLFFYSLIVILALACITLFIILLKKRKKEISLKDEVQFYKVPEEKVIENKVDNVKVEENELESVLRKMQLDLEKKENEPVKTFEQEQEEKSIISYQELLQANKKTIENKVEEPIKELEKALEEKSEPENRKFRTSEFISPIYGRVNNDYTYPIIKSFRETDEVSEPAIVETFDIEPSIDFDKLSTEIKKSEEFLNTLKEFRKKLD